MLISSEELILISHSSQEIYLLLIETVVIFTATNRQLYRRITSERDLAVFNLGNEGKWRVETREKAVERVRRTTLTPS